MILAAQALMWYTKFRVLTKLELPMVHLYLAIKQIT